MSTRGWKLYDDGESAVANGTPFRVSYFNSQHYETFLYFATKGDAFAFVQTHPELTQPEIKDLIANEFLYPHAPESK